MRENKGRGKGLEVLVVYSVRGLNLDRLINFAKNRGVDLFDVKKQANNRMKVAVLLKQSEKFFAIAEELCYNIRKIGLKGKGYPLYKLLTSLGVVIGGLIFILAQVVVSDFILAFSFVGTGNVYQREVERYLYNNGVRVYTRFSSVDLNALEDGILADGKRFSFVSCTKKGNRLVVELALARENLPVVDGNKENLIADVGGLVESIKVYRGTALVNVGDAVEKGDLLVDGFMTVKDQTVKINVLATVTILVKQEYVYTSNADGEEQKALALAEGELAEKEIVSSAVNKNLTDGQFEYIVTTYYRRTLFAG